MKHEQFQKLKDAFFFECQSDFARTMQEFEKEAVKNAEQIDDKHEALKELARELTFSSSTQSFEAAVRYCDKVVDALFEEIFEK